MKKTLLNTAGLIAFVLSPLFFSELSRYANAQTPKPGPSLSGSGGGATGPTGPTGATGASGVVASGTSTMGTSAIASTACATTVTTSATGTLSTDGITWTANADISAVTGYAPVTTGGLAVYAWPTADNVNFKVCNPTSSSITPGSAIVFNFKVSR